VVTVVSRGRAMQPPGKPVQYALDIDRERLLVTLRLAGFLTIADVMRIAGEEQALVQTLGVPSGTHLFLIDARALGAQAAEVVELIQHTTDTIPIKPRRLAILVRLGLNSMQTRRMVGEREIGLFEDEPDALAYLLG
jgi:hypothetical protein